jgi:hypothetical protein
MITSDGKTIIAKYLLNQAPEFVSHIAVGVGGNALSTSSSVTYSSSAESLDFEAFRVPVIAKGLIKEDGVEKLVFKAEMPTSERYRLTEIGLYPAESNLLAERYDSKTFISFTNSEPWTYVLQGSASAVPYVNQSLQVAADTSITAGGLVGNFITNATGQKSTVPAFFMNSNDPIFEYVDRINRREPPRFLSKSLTISGDFSDLNSSFVSASTGYYLENSAINLNLGNNLPTDQIKIAYSVISKTLANNDSPDTGVRIRLELINNVSGTPTAYVNIASPSAAFVDDLDPGKKKRYQVVTKQISDFTASADFSWSNINLIRIYADVIDATPSDYFIAFDGIRLENISTPNPLYSLIGAEYIKTSDGFDVLKQENSTAYIEYRFGLGIQ